jgi:hypothetical protein
MREDFEGVPPERATPAGVPRGLSVPLIGVLPVFAGVRGGCAEVSWAAAERQYKWKGNKLPYEDSD